MSLRGAERRGNLFLKIFVTIMFIQTNEIYHNSVNKKIVFVFEYIFKKIIKILTIFLYILKSVKIKISIINKIVLIFTNIFCYIYK